MQKKIQKLGVGEILFGLVIILGIAGTVSIFYYETPLGISQESFIILSSLAFIGAFFVLSVYARWIKRSHSRNYRLRKALEAWETYNNTPPDRVVRPLPKGTIGTIAEHFFAANGYTPVSDRAPQGEGMFLVMDGEGRIGLIQSLQLARPLTLRELVTFYEALRAAKAKHGEIWAPAGFNIDAAQWAAKKPITLVDIDGIHHAIHNLPKP